MNLPIEEIVSLLILINNKILTSFLCTYLPPYKLCTAIEILDDIVYSEHAISIMILTCLIFMNRMALVIMKWLMFP